MKLKGSKIKHFAALPDEKLIDEVVTRAWNFRSLLPPLIALTVVNLFTGAFGGFMITLSVFLDIYIIWWSTYMIRQRWRLSLTDKQIVAKQLFPRPFTFFSRDLHFPLNQIEGLTTGPRAFRSILLVGIFLFTNIGVNLLKSGLSTLSTGEPDPPDIVEAFYTILQGMEFSGFMVSIGNYAENASIYIFGIILPEIQVTMGIFFAIMGFLLVIVTLPRRRHIQIRVRNGADFKLNAGIPAEFWKACYKQIYKQDVMESPKSYKKWKFQWFKGEEAQTSADLEQTVYLNRFISIFAIWIGFNRLYERLISDIDFFDETFIWWVIVSIIDIIIAFAAFNFSKKKNELLITSKRIIFASEEKDISGIVGRRLYMLSDIRRDDVAGFYFRKIRAFSFGSLIAGMVSFGIAITFRKQMSIEDEILFIILGLLFISLTNQTYIQFNIHTKGGEVWILRHQLSNPATVLRDLVGVSEDSNLINTLFANRLEESEVVDFVQTLRTDDLNLPRKYVRDDEELKEGMHPIKKANLTLDNLLLQHEEVVYSTNVSRKVPRRVLNLTIASFLVLIWVSPFVSAYAIISEESLFDKVAPFFEEVFGLLIFLCIIMIIGLWVKYYSFYKASLMVTPQRVFFQDRREVPRWLYYLGVHQELKINETLRDQIHSTYTSRQFAQKLAMRSFIRHTIRWILWLTVFGILVAILVGLIELYKVPNPGIPLAADEYLSLIKLDILLIAISVLVVAWNGSNAHVELVRGWPKRIFNTKGIGIHYTIPFLKKEAAREVNYSIWSGQRLVEKLKPKEEKKI